MDPFSLTGKNVAITGASSGIGRACAVLAAKAGANVALIARSEENLRQTAALAGISDKHIFTQDITQYDMLENTIKTVVTQFGPISGFVHSAGIEMTLPLKVMKPEYYANLFATNVIGGFELARIISKKKYIAQNRASFVFIASIMSIVGRPGLVGYSSSKGALVAGVKSMALELAAKKINVNCVSPGTIMTEMIKNYFSKLNEEQKYDRIKDFPLGVGEPDDIAYAVNFLLSDAARWITGTNLVIDGGYTAR